MEAAAVTYKQHLDTVASINEQFRHFKTVESLFELDQWSALPSEGTAYRQQVAAHIADLKSSLFSTDDAAKAAAYFAGADLDSVDDEIERGLIRTFLFRYRNATRTPPDLTRSYSLIKADTMNAWKEAREKKDFRVFLPWLEQVFSLKRRIALAIDPDAPAFDTLVGLTDEGASCDEISREFDVLSSGIASLLKKIRSSAVKPDFSVVNNEEDPDRMEAFAQRLARESGYKDTRGSFNNRVVHGFSSFMGPRDGRVSTPKHGNLKLVFTYLHEAGHAMYSSGGSDRVNAANMWGGIEGAFQEGMARFNENMVGRSRAYWEHYYPQLREAFPDTYRDVPPEVFYSSVNAVFPSLRRISADEVTYSLHVILRYEIERDCFSGALAVRDAEERWNDLCEKYLGLRPVDPVDGILQDMHWAGDYIGYFQSYALGNLYSGQIMAAVRKALPDFDVRIAAGDFTALNAWLDENVRKYGCCYTAGELAEKISGKSLDAAPFLSYLEKKYGELYRL